MPRKPRIEFEGAFCHVITRSNQKQKIFKNSPDYQKTIQFLTIYKNRYHYDSLYAYVLMSNHVHLLIETRETPLLTILALPGFMWAVCSLLLIFCISPSQPE